MASPDPLGWVLLFPVAAVAFFQLFYLLNSFRVAVWQRPAGLAADDPLGSPRERVSVVIPVFNDASTLGGCLESIAVNDLTCCAKVVVVLDRCIDESEEVARSYVQRFAGLGVELDVQHLPEGRAGKVAGILHGGSVIDTDLALLMDSDIILAPTALAELAEFHRREKSDFSSCLIFPQQETGGSLASHVICNNRLYRQSVLQNVKNLFGLANFPGGLQLVDYKKYRDVLEHGFLEDLTATYRVIGEGGRVAILPRVLAHEVERQTIRGMFLQRTRWTLGAIQHLPSQVRAARTRRRLKEKIVVNSYHVMWEFQYYVMVMAPLIGLWQAAAWWPVYLLPYLLYTAQVLRSAYLTRRCYRHAPGGVLAHCAVFPSVITAALIGALAMLAVKRRMYFDTTVLFRRT
ncbi:glycosyltransferase [Kitasatospora sp. NPDC001683]